MARHGMGTATPVHMGQTEDDRRYAEVQRGTESRACLTRVHSHTLGRTNSAAHLCVWGPGWDLQAVAGLGVPGSRCAQGRNI